MTSNEPLFVDAGMNAPKPELPFIERDAITAVVYNPRTDKYLGLKWKKVDWDTLVTGGIEKGQSPQEAALAEVGQETGYKNLRIARELPRFHSKFYHHPKGENRYAHFWCFLVELVDDSQDPLSEEEIKKHQPVWLTKEEMAEFRLPDGHRFVFDSVFAE